MTTFPIEFTLPIIWRGEIFIAQNLSSLKLILDPLIKELKRREEPQVLHGIVFSLYPMKMLPPYPPFQLPTDKSALKLFTDVIRSNEDLQNKIAQNQNFRSAGEEIYFFNHPFPLHETIQNFIPIVVYVENVCIGNICAN